jgi:radical SAM protein with 4Fe4S-binding SPASM domain
MYRENDSGLNLAEMELTNKCNLNCKHCYVNKKVLSEIPFDKAKKIVSDLNDLGVNRLVFTGGETLLYKKLFDLADYSKELGVPDIVLLSNGILINEQNVKELKRFSFVQLSIDVPPGKEKILRADYSNNLVNTIDLLQKNGIKVTLLCTLNNRNYTYVKDFVEFASSKGIKISFNKLAVINNDPELKKLKLNKKQLKEALAKVAEYKHSCNVGCSDPLLFLVDEKRKKYYDSMDKKRIIGGCLAGITAIYICSNQDVYICPFVPKKIDSVSRKSIKTVWEKNRTLSLLRDRKNFYGKCSKCEYLNACGGCRGASFNSDKNLFGSDSNCFIDEL